MARGSSAERRYSTGTPSSFGRIAPLAWPIRPAAASLEHGADPNCHKLGGRMTALDYLIGTHTRSPEFPNCLELLVEAGGVTRYDVPCVLDLLRGRLDRVT